ALILLTAKTPVRLPMNAQRSNAGEEGGSIISTHAQNPVLWLSVNVQLATLGAERLMKRPAPVVATPATLALPRVMRKPSSVALESSPIGQVTIRRVLSDRSPGTPISPDR